MEKFIRIVLGLLVFVSVPLIASAQQATSPQVSDLQSQVQALLQKITQLQQQIGTQPASGITVGACPSFTRSLKVGLSGADVSALQQYLASDLSVYPEAKVTGYFGALTQAAVQRWQAKHSIVSSGTPATTGYGVVGPRTASAIAAACAQASAPRVGGLIQVNPISGNAPLSVNVTATVNTLDSCVGAVYTLDFGDGSQVQQIPVASGQCAQLAQTFTHVYNYGGTFQVKLSVGDHQTTATVSVSGAGQVPTVLPTPTGTLGLPQETFSASPVSGLAPLSVIFSGILTSNDAGFCPGGCGADLDFGDGATSPITLPASVGSWINYSILHTYTNAGGFRATMYQGKMGAITPKVGSSITITVGPVSSSGFGQLSVTPNVGSNPLKVSAQFNLQTACDSYQINWGDTSNPDAYTPSSSTVNCTPVTGQQTVNHTYSAAGAYTITLKRGVSLQQVDTSSISIQ